MKSFFKYVIFMILVLFMFNLKTNAKALMCAYQSENEDKSAMIYIEKGRYVVNFDGLDWSFLYDISELALASEAPGFVFFYGVPDAYVRYKNGVSYFDGTTFVLKHNKTKAQKIFYEDNDENSDSYIESELIDVDWRDSTEKTNFDKYGVCPSVIINDQSANTSDKASIIFTTEDDNTLTDNASLLLNTRFNYVENKGTMLTWDKISDVQSLSSCSNNAFTINKVAKILSMAGDDENSQDMDAVDKKLIAKLYINNGFDEVARFIVENYKTGGSCRTKEGFTEYYDKLYKAADSFLKTADSSYKDSDVNKCSDIIGNSKFAYYLDTTFKFIQYLAPILVIVLSTVSYAKAFFSGDADSLKKVNKDTLIRLMFAILLFIVPAIIRLLLNIVGLGSDCGVANL